MTPETDTARVAMYARQKANQLAGHYGITTAEADEIYLTLLDKMNQAAEHYDETKHASRYTFLMKVVRDAWKDAIRSHTRYLARIAKLGFEDVCHVEMGTAVDVLSLRLALDKLTAVERQLLHYAFDAQLTPTEIARLTKIPRTSVRRRLNHTIQKLRDMLAVKTADLVNTGNLF